MGVGLLVLVLDLLASSSTSYVPLGLGLILTGGFLHVKEQ